jgi:cell division transport system permease protein
MHAMREAMAAVRRAPLLTALSAAMVALALYVVGLFAVVTFNLHEALSRVEERVQVVAYMRDDARDAEIDLAREDLMEMEEVESIHHVSKDEALRVAREDLPEFEDLFAAMEVNPLPASLEIGLAPGFRTPDVTARIADRLSIYPFIEDVRYGEEWVDRLHLLQRIGALATTILGGAFAVVAALIIGTAIRIAIFARREEIHVMRLVGATNGFIRRPFLLEGALTGLMGGILASVLVFVSHALVSRAVFRLDWIPWEWVLLGIASGAFFGVLASAFAVRRYLREV